MSGEASASGVEGAPVAPVPPKKKRWRSVLLGILILVCGVVIGAGATALAIRQVIIHVILNPEKVPERLTARLDKKLHLSKEQSKQVEAIIARRLHNLFETRRESYKRVMEELDRLKEEVAAVLDEDQAQSWRKRFEGLERVIPSPTPPAKGKP